MYRRIAAGVVIGIFAVGWALPAAAYRPFDGTDAAVADVGEVEIEFQPLGAAHAGGTTKGLTDAILNYGFADRWELVLQSTPRGMRAGLFLSTLEQSRRWLGRPLRRFRAAAGQP
jgi:hypothetical protein